MEIMENLLKLTNFIPIRLGLKASAVAHGGNPQEQLLKTGMKALSLGLATPSRVENSARYEINRTK